MNKEIEIIDGFEVFNATKLCKPYGENKKPKFFLRSALAKQLIKKNNYFILIKGNEVKSLKDITKILISNGVNIKNI